MGRRLNGRPILFARHLMPMRPTPLLLSGALASCIACAATPLSDTCRAPSSGCVRLDAAEYDLMLAMPPDEARARYGETIDGYLCRDCEFTLAPPLSRFREELLTRFTPAELARGDIRVLELTWPVDDFRRLTIWYRRDGKRHHPVHQMVWNRTWRFDDPPGR